MLRRLSATLLLIALATPASAQERQWSLDASDQDAYLIFGVPESDDVGISFWCTVQKDEVNIFVPEGDPKQKPGQAVDLIISAGGETATLKGRTEENEEGATTSVEAKAPADLPVFAAMLKADRFHVKTGEIDNVFPLIDADLRGLLDVCHKP